MSSKENAPPSATKSLALETAANDLIKVHRDAVKAAAELLEEGLREQFGWSQKEQSPVALAKLLFRASRRPDVEYPGLGDILDAYDMIAVIAETPAPKRDTSPEGLAIARLAARDARR